MPNKSSTLLKSFVSFHLNTYLRLTPTLLSSQLPLPLSLNGLFLFCCFSFLIYHNINQKLIRVHWTPKILHQKLKSAQWLKRCYWPFCVRYQQKKKKKPLNKTKARKRVRDRESESERRRKKPRSSEIKNKQLLNI